MRARRADLEANSGSLFRSEPIGWRFRSGAAHLSELSHSALRASGLSTEEADTGQDLAKGSAASE